MKRIVLLLISLLPLGLAAQEFSIGGEIRPRLESNQGYKTLRPATNDIGYNEVSQRSRLNFWYTNATDRVQAKVVLQDIRIWNTTPTLVNDATSLGVHEAWARVGLADKVWLKIGRQELVYDNHRIFGDVGWAQQARTHDMALLQYDGAVQVHLGAAFAPTAPKYQPMSYHGMQYLWVNKKTDVLNLSFLALNNGNMHNGSVKYSQTLGTYITYKASDLDVMLSAYYQMGKDARDYDLGAYDLNIELGYKLPANLKALVGAEILSGTDQDNSEKTSQSFNPFYGTNHKFNGLMDYFYVGNHANSVGLVDLYARLAYSKGKFGIDLTPHLLSAQATMISGGEEIGSNLGTEIDLTASYKLNSLVGISGGVSTLFATESMEHLRPGDSEKTAVWSWLMITIQPKFFDYKKQ